MKSYGCIFTKMLVCKLYHFEEFFFKEKIIDIYISLGREHAFMEAFRHLLNFPSLLDEYVILVQ